MALIKTNARSATALDATILTGNLPAINGSAITTINATNISSGTLNAARYTGGKILQVATTYSGGTNTTTVNSSSADIQVGESITMTPASSSSKFHLLWVAHMVAFDTSEATAMTLLTDFRRVITGGATTDNLLKDSVGASNLQYVWQYDARSSGTLPKYFYPCITTMYEDSPSTTSAVTYHQMYAKNMWAGTTTSAAGFYEVGIFTVMEIGA